MAVTLSLRWTAKVLNPEMKNLKGLKEELKGTACFLLVNTALEIKSQQESLRHQRVSSESGIAQRKEKGESKK